MKTNSGDLKAHKNNAIAYLVSKRSKDGFFRDYKTLAGYSDEWITGYVGYCLAAYGETPHKELAGGILKKLLRNRIWKQGWGYNRNVPSDADSTIWVNRLAATAGVSNSLRIKRSVKFLLKHIDDGSGGVKTYCDPFWIRLFTKVLDRNISFKGWCMPHVCVSAAFSLLDNVDTSRVRDFLRNNQHADGSWDGYWWRAPEYATALAVESLAQTGNSDDAAMCEMAATWAKEKMAQMEMNPFSAALFLRILVFAPGKSFPEIDDLVQYLFRSQHDNGGWEPGAYLRIPPPYLTDPEAYHNWRENTGGGGSYQKDIAGIFTTATVIMSLGALIKVADD